MKRKIACMLMALVLVISLLPLGAIRTYAASAWYPSENVVNLIKQFEGFSATAYWDVNQWTIGYGTTGYSGQYISEAEADQALRSKLNNINSLLNQFAARNNLYLSQNQHDALLCFSFNCGTDWMSQNGRFAQAVVRNAGVNEFLFAISLWANVGSTPDANLLRRRLSEANLYLNGVYSTSAPAAYTYVILDPNGGVAGNNGEDKMQAYLSGSNAPILAGNPTKAGATFAGWFTAPVGGNGVKSLSSLTAGQTLYAQYGTAVTVTSTYANVRNGAGNNYVQVGTVSGGAQLVIVETAQVNGALWGRFADGWIALEYTSYNGQQLNPIVSNGTNGTVVCNSGVNVRNGAGTTAMIVGSAYNGQRVTVYETVNVGGKNWGRIGEGRWICLDYVKMDTTSVITGGSSVVWDPQYPTTTPSGTGTYQLGVVNTNGLNVRTAAGVGNTVVAILNKGTQVKVYSQIIKDNAPWGKIDQGWVCMNYVTLNTTAVGTPIGTVPGTTPTVTNPGSGTVIATGTVSSKTALNVRSGAGTAAPRVSALNPGTPVSIYEKVTVNGMEWGRIGVNQWICLAYVKLNTTSTPSTSVPTTGTGTVISSTNLNVRNGAGGNYTKVGSLTPGSVVTVYELVTNGNQQWGRIGVNQWVCMTYVRMGNSGTQVVPSSGFTGRVISSGQLNVRAAAGTNNAIVGKLASGSTVTIYETTNVNGVAWGRISNGWVCMTYIQTTTSGVIWQ